MATRKTLPVSQDVRVMDFFRQYPFEWAKLHWPDVYFYDKQREIVKAVRDSAEVFVSAGNMLGKDFISAFIILWFFMTRHPVRIITTSADHAQLEAVLWGEMRKFIDTSKLAMTVSQGGLIFDNHLHLRKLDPSTGKRCGISYCLGRVAAKGEGMLGHHVAEQGDGIPRTLFVADEASGVDDVSYERADTWARRKLIIGNPYNGYPGCTFFKKYVLAGDLLVE